MTVGRGFPRAFGGLLLIAMVLAACGDGDEQATEAREPEPIEVELVGTGLLGALARTAGERLALDSPVEAAVTDADAETALELLCAGEGVIAMTDRPIAPAERRECRRTGIQPLELLGAYQAVAVARNPDLDVDCLTTRQLSGSGARTAKWSGTAQSTPRCHRPERCSTVPTPGPRASSCS